MDDEDATRLGEQIADLEDLLERAVGNPGLQRQLGEEIVRLRSLIVLARERAQQRDGKDDET